MFTRAPGPESGLESEDHNPYGRDGLSLGFEVQFASV